MEITGVELEIAKYEKAVSDGLFNAEWPLCEECGRPATNFYFDFYKRDNIDLGIKEHKQTARHERCPYHPGAPLEIDLGWNFNPITGERWDW